MIKIEQLQALKYWSQDLLTANQSVSQTVVCMIEIVQFNL